MNNSDTLSLSARENELGQCPLFSLAFSPEFFINRDRDKEERRLIIGHYMGKVRDNIAAYDKDPYEKFSSC